MNYISILRGINVGGQKKIKMDDLKSLYESLGLQNIKTYIQSGNVIFSTNSKSRVDLKLLIEKAIHKKYGFHVHVQIRTNDEIMMLINNCPFGAIDIQKDGTKVLVTFLSSPPSRNAILETQQSIISPEKLVVSKDIAYLYCPNGYGTSKLSNNFLESKLNVEATTRNWKTVSQLYEISR